MIDILLCGYNISCHFNNINYYYGRPKYNPDVAQICYYFEEQKVELPDYCKWQESIQQPRKRNEF